LLQADWNGRKFTGLLTPRGDELKILISLLIQKIPRDLTFPKQNICAIHEP
jgi:hypothetical protein